MLAAAVRWVVFAQEHGGEVTEHAEEPSGLDLILPAVPELIGGALAFAVVFFALNKLAFPKLREAIETREKTIQTNLEDAERARNEARAEQERYQRQIADARSEGNRIIEEARSAADQVRRDLVAKAEKEAEGIVARAQEQIGAERDRALQELQGTIGRISVELAERVVGRSIDAAAQRDLVDSYIREVAGMSNGGGRG